MQPSEINAINKWNPSADFESYQFHFSKQIDVVSSTAREVHGPGKMITHTARVAFSSAV